MTRETIEANKWIFVEGGTPAYFVYRLLSGKVSIYSSGHKINEMEVKKGGKPALLGIFAALRDDRLHTASVKTDTEIQVERIYIDQIKGALKNDIPEAIKGKIATMIEAIVILNEIESLQQRLSTISKVTLDIPPDMRPETSAILGEISELYKKLTS